MYNRLESDSEPISTSGAGAVFHPIAIKPTTTRSTPPTRYGSTDSPRPPTNQSHAPKFISTNSPTSSTPIHEKPFVSSTTASATSPPPPPPVTSVHFRSLTGIRGLAAFYVFLYHFGSYGCSDINLLGARNGRVAVSMFFCLSGFIMQYTYGHCSMESWSCKASFWFKRFVRIMPAYYVMLLMNLNDVRCMWGDDPAAVTTGQYYCSGWKWLDIVLHLFGLSTWIPINTFDWNDVSWSVQTEMGFYFAFPFYLQLFNYIIRRWGYKGWWYAFITVLIYSVLPTFALGIFSSIHDPISWRLYVLPWTRSGEFMMGMILCSVYLATNKRHALAHAHLQQESAQQSYEHEQSSTLVESVVNSDKLPRSVSNSKSAPSLIVALTNDDSPTPPSHNNVSPHTASSTDSSASPSPMPLLSPESVVSPMSPHHHIDSPMLMNYTDDGLQPIQMEQTRGFGPSSSTRTSGVTLLSRELNDDTILLTWTQSFHPWKTDLTAFLLIISLVGLGWTELLADWCAFGTMALPCCLCLITLAMGEQFTHIIQARLKQQRKDAGQDLHTISIQSDSPHQSSTCSPIHPTRSRMVQFLSTHLMYSFGEISYCFYLVHHTWIGLALWAGYHLPPLSTATDIHDPNQNLNPNLSIPYFFMTIGFSALLHLYVELPAYQAGVKFINKKHKCRCSKEN